MPLPEECLSRPEERVLRQLVEALLFEKLLAAEWRSTDDGDYLHWRLRNIHYRCRARIGAFGRVRITAGSLQQNNGQGWQPAGLPPLVAALPALPRVREQLAMELAQTVRLCRWNRQQLAMPRSRRGLDFAGLEAALDEGHPYHPCFKARTGFSETDHRQYGPEAAARFQLVWLAVERSGLRQSLPAEDTAFWLSELGGEAWDLLSTRLHGLGGSWQQYGLLPLHPWQWQQRHARLADGLEQGRYLFLGAAGDHYQASQSVRTLLNADHPHKANIKLAMNMVNSSSLRTLAPHSVCSAPAISHWLTGVVASDPLFSTRYPLALLAEYAGMIADDEGQLAAIWRQSLTPLLQPGEQAVPFNALMMLEQDGRPFIADWLDRHGLEPWLDRLFEVVVLPVWHLLVAHGIALEAHGQNMVLVHRNGWPVRLVLRDFHESVEYVPAFLREPERVPDFPALDPCYRKAAPNQYYWMETLELLRELVMDTLFVFNLSEVSNLLESHCGLPENRFWSRLALRLETYASEHQLQTRQRRLGHDARQLYTESLLTRKLSGNRVDYHHLIDNPLCAEPHQES
ncbi:IucA/IucC family protein [Oceanimonas marisflavi]|uniref:IucA/IucC family protein n=1 Tax=Oceanimonas marisflavi TaxID=2059724 RepID=UPI0018E4DEC8|nr:IucA/IucC family protein [Oceanimonas marisflavi]